MAKSEQLQLRVSREQKERIKRQAALAGQDVSKWVLDRLLPSESERLRKLVSGLLCQDQSPSFTLAAIHDFVQSLSDKELACAISELDLNQLPGFEANYVAALVEQACVATGVPKPGWLEKVSPLETPWFASTLKSLRLHLLRSSPPSFRRRNIFVDTTLGGRI